ncbi:phage tail protein [Pseudomonas sp. ArH3a]|uniref:phage tail-collar fiber domain-containing protein n=1 Tax=Pseudomonas sp. ArH3a TaxID=2862945 RepID=UPI001F55D1D0|nr:phage tail protein [Pseudomonas sp. ArH3a]UNM18590.1 phage tail protein [Pseudomonas sp. ArH3a]
MGASITLAGESLIAQKQAANAGLKVSRFIFANVPGLNPDAPVDRAAPKPAAGQIVYMHEIATEHAGYVNPDQVVYSAQIGSDVGDWDFNWIGLETSEGVLFAVAYVPAQQKRRNVPPLQVGNNLTRNFLVAFDGALAVTGITIDASTWQHDFTVRLAGIDERERLSNRDVYGRACFFGSSLQLEKVAGAYQLKPGTAYVEGIRLVQTAALSVVPPALPAKAWLDVVLQRELSDLVASWTVVFGAGKADYTDALGVRHYCVAIADLTTAGVTDVRPVEAISGPLVQQFALRTGDYAQLRARATTKDDVELGNIPNAISDDFETNSSSILATTKAVKAAASVIWTAIANIVSGATVVGKAARLAVARRITVNGAVNGSVDFDGSGDVVLTVSQAQASEGVAGTARVATQPGTDAGIDDTTFISPKKLRWGFNGSWTVNGFIVFPTWLGGVIIQWGEGVVQTAADSVQTVAFPLTFPNSCFQVNAGTSATGTTDDAHYILTGKSLSNATFKQESDNFSVHNIKPTFMAIGR